MRISTRIRMLLESERLHRRRRVGTRRGGTWLVAAALAGIGVAATADALRGEKEVAPSAVRQAAMGAKTNTAEEGPAPTPAGLDDLIEAPPRRRSAVTEDSVTFSFRVPKTVGWERFRSLSTDKSAGGPISINKSIVGPQGAEAIIYWTSFPDGDYADSLRPSAESAGWSIGRRSRGRSFDGARHQARQGTFGRHRGWAPSEARGAHRSRGRRL
jgi:hypothetical protein